MGNERTVEVRTERNTYIAGREAVAEGLRILASAEYLRELHPRVYGKRVHVFISNWAALQATREPARRSDKAIHGRI